MKARGSIWKLGIGAAALAAAFGPGVLAADSADERPTRVYTNDDLEPLPPPSPETAQARAAVQREGADEGWDFVRRHLEREYARIEADRTHTLEREIVEGEFEQRATERYVLPFTGYGFHRGYGHGNKLRPIGKHDRRARASISSSGFIRPLHARPTQSQIQWNRAQRHSGADAVPARGR